MSIKNPIKNPFAKFKSKWPSRKNISKIYDIQSVHVIKILRSCKNQQGKKHSRRKNLQRLWRGNSQMYINNLYHEKKDIRAIVLFPSVRSSVVLSP